MPDHALSEAKHSWGHLLQRFGVHAMLLAVPNQKPVALEAVSQGYTAVEHEQATKFPLVPECPECSETIAAFMPLCAMKGTPDIPNPSADDTARRRALL